MILNILLCLVLVFISLGPVKLFSAEEAVMIEEPESIGLRRVEYKADELKDPFRNPFIRESNLNQDGESAAPAFDNAINFPVLNVQGVIWGGNVPLVIINNKVLKVGDSIEDCRILEISKEGVSVFYINNRRILPLPGCAKRRY